MFTTIQRQQKGMAKTQDAKFIPFAVEMYGGLGRSAKKLLKMISKCARDQMLMWPYHQIIQNLKGEIAVSIQRGNAIAILLKVIVDSVLHLTGATESGLSESESV